MILLDTHIFVWWLNEESEHSHIFNFINSQNTKAISIITIWEIAKLIEVGRLKLDRDLKEWLDVALKRSDIIVLELSNQIIIKSTKLEGTFHKDPADQIIVATSIIFDIPLLTMDKKIIDYPFVNKVKI